MASMLPTARDQGPVLFEDLAVFFSQEECVSLHSAQRSLSRDTTQECFEDMALMAGGEGKTEITQQLNLDSTEVEELARENPSIAVPLVYYPEKSSETGGGDPERKVSGGTPACKKRFISLLVTIENHTPLIELSQCLETTALSEILEFPGEEARSLYKCPECDQSFGDNSCLVLHQKTLSGEKYKCADCGKIFNHRANLRTHRRIHTGKKPYKCAECGSSFRQHSHLSQHMNIHVKEKPHICGICGRGFMWLPGLSQHQKTHTAKKVYECTNCCKSFGKKTNLALHEETHPSATQYRCPQCVKCFGQPSHPVLPEQGHEDDSEDDSEHCGDCGGNVLLFSKFKPLKCPECTMTFLRVSELISHQSIHRGEKPHQCITCAESFILDSELACHQKSHMGEEPFNCTRCGKSFRLNGHLVIHQQTHKKTTM